MRVLDVSPGQGDVPTMLSLRWIQVALLVATCLLLAGALLGGGRPRVVALDAEPARTREAPDPDPAVAAFLGTLTPDDVARGVWDLAVAPGAPSPDPAQAAALAARLAEARESHARLSGLRAERRRLTVLLLEDGARIARLAPEVRP